MSDSGSDTENIVDDKKEIEPLPEKEHSSLAELFDSALKLAGIEKPVKMSGKIKNVIDTIPLFSGKFEEFPEFRSACKEALKALPKDSDKELLGAIKIKLVGEAKRYRRTGEYKTLDDFLTQITRNAFVTKYEGGKRVDKGYG